LTPDSAQTPIFSAGISFLRPTRPLPLFEKKDALVSWSKLAHSHHSDNQQVLTMRLALSVASILLLLHNQGKNVEAFMIQSHPASPMSPTKLSMALDNSMNSRLDGIRRLYLELTERLGDPDVLGDSKLLQKVMSDRAKSEEVVMTYDKHCQLKEELQEATELFQEAGDDPEMKEMARAEIKGIEPQMDELEEKIKLLLLPKDPNDDRNVMLEIRAGTGGSEASIFAGE
jgi:hypothetical protein